MVDKYKADLKNVRNHKLAGEITLSFLLVSFLCGALETITATSDHVLAIITLVPLLISLGHITYLNMSSNTEEALDDFKTTIKGIDYLNPRITLDIKSKLDLLLVKGVIVEEIKDNISKYNEDNKRQIGNEILNQLNIKGDSKA